MTLKWEILDQRGAGGSTERIKVPTGWILKETGRDENPTIIFIPDPSHEWKPEYKRDYSSDDKEMAKKRADAIINRETKRLNAGLKEQKKLRGK